MRYIDATEYHGPPGHQAMHIKAGAGARQHGRLGAVARLPR
jgi:hypothetical protein